MGNIAHFVPMYNGTVTLHLETKFVVRILWGDRVVGEVGKMDVFTGETACLRICNICLLYTSPSPRD